MLKKIFFIFLFLLFLAGIRAHSLRAQKEQGADPTQSLARIESRLEELTTISGAQKELNKKLDLVLSNQDKIIAELAIIKVRASKR